MKLSINLASRRYINQRALKLALYGGIVLLLVVLAIQANIYLKNRQFILQHQIRVESLQKQLNNKLPQRLTSDELAEQRLAYDRAEAMLQRDAFNWTVLFDRMEKLLPDGISLRSFNPDYDKQCLVIIGVSKNLANLQALLDNLQDGQFKQVYLKNQGEVEVDNGRGGKRTALSFSISLEGVF